MTSISQFDAETQNNILQWLAGQDDEMTKKILLEMIEINPKEVQDAFFTRLSFGTAGLRGLMGIGSNRLNLHTIRGATQGLANYILKQPQNKKDSSVFIGYDSRHHSKEFAEESAKVLAANGIQVYLYQDIRPTPLVSYGCRLVKCDAAIMITASHNPPEYNGYKVYGADGAQIVSPHDVGIITEVNKMIDPSMIKLTSIDSPLITKVGTEIDDSYLKESRSLQCYPDDNKEKGNILNIVYTSLHGTGIALVPRVLQDWGFTHLELVKEQVIPDGSFSTVKSPNPEEKAAMALGIDLLLKSQSDLLLATDPDADRMGVGVRHARQAVLLTGHQILAICLEHICEALTTQKRVPARGAFIKTIGTTELFQSICDHYHLPCFNVLTGFKYIGEKIREWENLSNGYHYIFGGEESYGSLLGTKVRDKDAVISCALICEVALQAKLQGKTLVDKLHELYQKYGIFAEKALSVNFEETKEGKERMTVAMHKLRQSSLKQINSIPVKEIEDYQSSLKTNVASGQTERLTLPVSNIVLYWLADGSKVMVRPSGTEPKIKLSCGVCEKNFTSVEEGLGVARRRCDEILDFIQKEISQI